MHRFRNSTTSSRSNVHTVASMHLEPAAPVYNTLARCDSMPRACIHARTMSYWDRGQTLAAQPPDAVPLWTWEPMSAAMRRMQVQVRKKLPCVMSPVFCRGGVRHVGLREESTRKSKSFEDLDLGFGSHQTSERNPKRHYSRAIDIREERFDGFRRIGLRAARLRRHLVARLTTVACDANVIAVSYQRTGSFQLHPVDTGRAFAKPFFVTTLQHRAANNATFLKSEIGVARCHAQSESL